MATEPVRDVNFGKSAYTDEEKAMQQAILQKKLGKEFVSTRVGPGGRALQYISGFQSVELANEIFGFNGWSDRIVEINQDFIEHTNKGLWECSYSAVVRVMLKDGTYHEDIGCGEGISPSKAQSIENAKKGAVTDARKRALKGFGNVLGNSLYDTKHLRDLTSNKTGFDTLDSMKELKGLSTPVSCGAGTRAMMMAQQQTPTPPSESGITLKRQNPLAPPSGPSKSVLADIAQGIP